MTHRCRDCLNRPQFSRKTGTVMKETKMSHKDWAIAVYLLTTNLKGVPSMKLHRDLDITQRRVSHLKHRLRKTFETTGQISGGSAKSDEIYIGGLEKNGRKDKKLNPERGGVGKSIVAGDVKGRETNQVVAEMIRDTTAKTFQGFVEGHTEPIALACTDEGRGHVGIDRAHESVNGLAREYVRDMAHTNGIESFRSMMGGGHKGVSHEFSKKPLQENVDEFAGCHNARNADTLAQMQGILSSMVGKQLRYKGLGADNGLASGARP